jgi:hypothetical protein
VRIALAEAALETGDAKGAMEAALAAQQTWAKLHKPEHEWRAWLIAARASQRLGAVDAMRDQLSQARKLFKALQKLWGDEAFNAYKLRTDVQTYQQQMDHLTALS